ncbi:MAG: cysteine hydrolase [Ruminococcus sp.]|nr:cysteine hydrolase [Ruminococcus sp.]
MMKLLIIVDYQNDYVNGSLGFEGAELLDRKIAHKIRDYRKENGEIIYTMDTHQEDYLSTQEGRKLPTEHCIEDTQGHRLYGFTAKERTDKDKVFYKDTFGSIEMANYLKFKNYDTVELVGLVSNMGVIANAVLIKAALPETEVIVNTEYTASADKELEAKAFDVMEGLQITVVRPE